MKSIGVYGCSWSQGIYPKLDNWVRHLAKLMPDYTFYNYGLGGTDFVYHSYLLDQTVHLHDKTIFQVTSQGRFTWWDDHSIAGYMAQQDDTVVALYGPIDDVVHRINHGIVYGNSNLSATDKLFGGGYYERITQYQLQFEMESAISLIKPKVDLCFTHREYNLNTEIPSMQTLAASNYTKFLMDDGDHFNYNGNAWQAKLIYDQLNI